MSRKYYSQAKQDYFINKYIFKNNKAGFFVEIGAYDGITYSNALFFEKYLGWSGVCIEPIEKYYNMLLKSRSAKSYNVAIGKEKGVLEFIHVENAPMFSGLVEGFTKKELADIKKNNRYSITKVSVLSFSSILRENRIKRIHYLSIDAEGFDFDILKNIDLDSVFIDVISIEDNELSGKIDAYLNKRGFVLIKHAIFDKIFINKKSSFFNNYLYLHIIKAGFLNIYIGSNIDKLTRGLIKNNPFLEKLAKKFLQV